MSRKQQTITNCTDHHERKRSPKRLIVLFRAKKWTGMHDQEKFFPTLRAGSVPLPTVPVPHFQIRSGATKDHTTNTKRIWPML